MEWMSDEGSKSMELSALHSLHSLHSLLNVRELCCYAALQTS